MTKQELNQAIEKIAAATSQTKVEIAKKLAEKDSWTWFLIREAS